MVGGEVGELAIGSWLLIVGSWQLAMMEGWSWWRVEVDDAWYDVEWRYGSGIFALWTIGCVCISMDLSITIPRHATAGFQVITLEKLVDSEKFSSRWLGIGQ
jgi:hypothetical protein